MTAQIARASMGLAPGMSFDEFGALVEAASQHGNRESLLGELLEESAAVYHGRSANTVLRMRGFVLAVLGRDGLPESLLKVVLAELENARAPYTIAAAARALRGLANPPPVAADYLLRALVNVQYHDDAVNFVRCGPGGHFEQHTSAVLEIVESLEWMGSAVQPVLGRIKQICAQQGSPLAQDALARLERIASVRASAQKAVLDCCQPASAALEEAAPQPAGREFREAVAFDQEGRSVNLGDHCLDKVSIVAFFYTRCDNPNKCSLTVTRLAELQQKLKARGLSADIQVIGVTYDSHYDSPALLKTYGQARAFSFSESDRFFRIPPADWRAVAEFFRLGVSYSESVVNQHRVELYVLDRECKLAVSFTRLQWSDDEVLTAADRVARGTSQPLHERAWTRGSAAGSVALTVAIALLPKCPLCWAAYLSLFGIVGISVNHLSTWLEPVLYALLVTNLLALSRYGKAGRAPLALGAFGAACLLSGRGLDIELLTYSGAFSIACASLFSILGSKVFARRSGGWRRLFWVRSGQHDGPREQHRPVVL